VKIQKLFFILYLSLIISDSFAFSTENKQFNIEANSIWVDVKQQIITAEGNVIITVDRMVFSADKAMYNKQSQQLVVVGNLNINSNKKYSFFGQRAFFDHDQKMGNIVQFSARLKKKMFLTSAQAVILGEKKFVAKDIVFTTCRICANNFIPNKPLWQINADKVSVDLVNESMSLKKSKVRLLNVPLIYIPQLNLPLPGASRRSGFLFPVFKYSDTLGVQINIKHYLNLQPSTDLVYSPLFSTKKNSIHHLYYRHLTRYGKYYLGGCIVNGMVNKSIFTTKKNNWNSYIYSRGEFDYGNYMFMNYQFQSVLNGGKTFLENYNISDYDVMSSYVNFFQTVDYDFFSLIFLYFQDLRTNRDKTSTNYNQFVFPSAWATNKFQYKVPFMDDMLFNTNFYNLYNTGSERSTLMNMQLEGIKSKITDLGLKIDIMPSIRLCHFAKYRNKTHMHISGDFFINTILPLIKNFRGNNIIIEPFANLALVANQYKIFVFALLGDPLYPLPP